MATALLSAGTALDNRSSRFKIAVPPSPTASPSAPLSDFELHEVVEAIEGNHLAIEGLLQRVLQRPGPAEFASANQRPGYIPAERLIIKRPSDRRLVAHVQLQPFAMRFGQTRIPAIRLRDLAVQPEYEIRGFGDQLLLAAEQAARRSGAMLMVTHGAADEALARCGWARLGDDSVSIVSPQQLLAQLPPPRKPESPFYANAAPRTEVRLGRLTDLDAMRRLYEGRTACSYGPPRREPDYWSWLVCRRAHDLIYLLTENEEPLAYAVVCGSSIVELVDSTADNRAAARLLARVGADAIEQGRHALRIHAPLSHRVHAWSERAGGQVFGRLDRLVGMAKIVSPRLFLRRVASELRHRHFARLRREVSLQIDAEALLLRPAAQGLHVTRGLARKHRLAMSSRAATQLLLGYRGAGDLAARGQLAASTGTALEAAHLLFPPHELWWPRWEEVPVMRV